MKFICLQLILLTSFWTFGVAEAQTPRSAWRAVKLPIPDGQPVEKIIFAGLQTGWITAGKNTILKTTDGGLNWTVLKTNLELAHVAICELWFQDRSIGWAAGSINQKPAIWRTKDGGSSWVEIQTWSRSPVESGGAMLDIHFASPTYAWAVGYNGFDALIVASTDAGQHWGIQYSGAEITGQFSRVEFSDPLHGWCLSNNAVMRTEDGGQSWRLEYFGNGLLNDLNVIGPAEPWMAGGWNQLVQHHSWNGWIEVPLKMGASRIFLAFIKFVDKDRGWATSTEGDIFRTLNAGNSWTRESRPASIDRKAKLITGAIAATKSNLFLIANPAQVWIRAVN